MKKLFLITHSKMTENIVIINEKRFVNKKKK